MLSEVSARVPSPLCQELPFGRAGVLSWLLSGIGWHFGNVSLAQDFVPV
jgi:hypothetical protein